MHTLNTQRSIFCIRFYCLDNLLNESAILVGNKPSLKEKGKYKINLLRLNSTYSMQINRHVDISDELWTLMLVCY